jgi:glycosyltransferase involved in cell wall biosynthesis
MRISVAMCTYNGAKYLEEQIASIIAQTVQPIELVVCDDLSIDGTMDILERVADEAPFPIRVFSNETRLGSTENFARATSLCTGDIIALADQDDVWLPEKLETLGRLLEDDPELGAVFSDAEVVDEGLHPLGYSMFEFIKFGPSEQHAISTGQLWDVLTGRQFVTGATLVFRASLKRFILPIPPSHEFMIHDRWIAIIAGAVSRLGLSTERLIKYRQHQNQQMGAPRESRTPQQALRTIASRDRNLYLEHLGFLSALRGWVLTAAGEAVRSDFLEALDSRIRHLEFRTGLPRSRWHRLRAIAAEVASGRYRRFSKGIYSALKDVR